MGSLKKQIEIIFTPYTTGKGKELWVEKTMLSGFSFIQLQTSSVLSLIFFAFGNSLVKNLLLTS